MIRSLGDKRARTETGLFVAEGAKLVEELLASDFVVREVYRESLDRISHLKTPSDCLALVEIPKWKFSPAALKGKLVIALDEVQNPGNVGTIIRLADWFGVTDVLASEGTADCFNPKVVQATMGAITRVRVHYGNLPEMISSSGLPVYGTFLDGENIYKTALSPEGVVVFGSEGRGISAEVEATVSRRLFIPSRGSRAESLNVAVAAGIVCSEFFR